MDVDKFMFFEEGISDEIIMDIVPVDEELVHSTLKPPPTSLNLLKNVPVSSNCDTVCHYKGTTYVGLFNHDIDKIDQNYQLIPSFITQNGLVFSVGIYQDRIYSLLFGRPYIVNVHELTSGELITSWNHPDDLYSHNKMAIVNDKVVIADRRSKLLSLYELSGVPLKGVPCPRLGTGYVAMCKASSDSVIVSDSVCARLFRVNIATGNEMWSCDNLETIPHAVACDEQQYVYVAGHKSNKIWVRDINTGAVVSEMEDNNIKDLKGVYDLCLFEDVLAVPAYDSRTVLFFKLCN